MNATPTDKATQIARVKELLQDYDHGFITAEGVRYFTEPFGFVGTTYLAHDTRNEHKGLKLEGGATEAEGQDAEEVAGQICRHLGVAYPPMMGRGFRHRTRCEAILRYLGE